MENKLLEILQAFQTIIIHRHSKPDGDALGCQIGLKEALKTSFPNKKILVTGDMNERFAFIGKMDEIPDEYYEKALVIIVDTGNLSLVSDERYKLGKYIIKIDHHNSGVNYGDLNIVDVNEISCASLVTRLILNLNLQLNDWGARALFTGLVTDSGRFRYSGVDSNSFDIASILTKYQFSIDEIYDNLYTEGMNMVRLRALLTLSFKTTDHNVAYLKTKFKEIESYGTDFFTISRGMVGIMAGIRGIDIWVNFTEDDTGKIIAEIRSNKYNINSIAVKYGGGGHRLASGATLNSFEEADLMIKDLENLIVEDKHE